MMNEFWTNRTPSTVLQTPIHKMKQYRMSGGSQGRTEPQDGNGPKHVACKATSLYRQFNAFTTSRSYSI